MPSFFARLKPTLYFFVFKLLLIGVAIAMLWLDIKVFHTDMLEISFTEITQEAMLFACALLFWFAPTAGERPGFNYLTAGFFACLLMRELDGLFDPISHSAWCWPFLAIAVFAVVNALHAKRRPQTLRMLESFVSTPVFATLSTGFAVLMFSRVFGMGSFWHEVLGAGYARVAKTTVEEGVELLAYSMWFAASVEHYVQARAERARATEAQTSAGETPASIDAQRLHVVRSGAKLVTDTDTAQQSPQPRSHQGR